MTWKGIGPLSYQGSGKKQVLEKPSRKLRVETLAFDDDMHTSGRPALVSGDDWAVFQEYLDGAPAFLQLVSGSDCLVSLARDDSIPPGVVRMEHAQRVNLHVVVGDTYSFSVWEGPDDDAPLDLVDLDLEVQLQPTGPSDDCDDEAPAHREEATPDLHCPQLGVSSAASARPGSGRDQNSDEGLRIEGCVSTRAPAAPEKNSQGGIARGDQVPGGSGAASAHAIPDSPAEPSSDERASGGGAKGELGGSGSVQLDAGKIERELRRTHVGRVLAVSQLVPLTVDGRALVLRVSVADNLDADARAEALVYHCFRGRLAPDTKIYLAQSSNRCNLHLSNVQVRPTSSSRDVVNVYTSDGEHFPVKKRILRPCLSLTSAVRSAEECVDANVDIDTLTFDRVLMFLQALALSKPAPNFGAHLLEALLDAGNKLACQSLVSFCENKMGLIASRISLHSWQGVQAANAKGLCWLVLDGMVLDVTNWLSEHPGGSTIIPAQALNLDCSRFFEVYHASRESFLYLSEFYVGEVREQDLDLIPRPDEPSEDFMAQLRSFTPWRISAREVRSFKSF